MFFQKVNKLVCNLFALSEHKQINKIRYRLRIAGAGTPGHHKRSETFSVLTFNRNAAQIQHIKNISITQLILQRKSYHIKFGQAVAAFKSEQRNIVPSHLLFHIHPRSKDSLTPCIFAFINKAVKYFHTEMRHTYFIVVRKAKGIPEFNFTFIFYNAVYFAADISCRLLHFLQKKLLFF